MMTVRAAMLQKWKNKFNFVIDNSVCVLYSGLMETLIHLYEWSDPIEIIETASGKMTVMEWLA